MSELKPINFMRWINEHRDLLKPPVGNKMVWKDREFIVMVVGGPNGRTDYHINEGEEFFYQIEGNITLRTFNKHGRREDIKINEGEIFLLPPNVPHSPQRPEGTVGLVIERRRNKGENDGLRWYCNSCDEKVYEEYFHLTNIETNFGAVFDRFYGDKKNYTCQNCGAVNNQKTFSEV